VMFNCVSVSWAEWEHFFMPAIPLYAYAEVGNSPGRRALPL